MNIVVVVFFDLENAYDTIWRYGSLNDIYKLGLRKVVLIGTLPSFVKSFQADRTGQVLVGSSLSTNYNQEKGVPQGVILTSALFNIKIIDTVKC